MLNPRLFVILSALADGETAVTMVLDALSQAARPYGIHFAIPAQYADHFIQASIPANTVGPNDIKYYEESAGLSAVALLVTDETHFLSLTGEYVFTPHWDRALFSRFAKCKTKRKLLTATITPEDGQPCLPALRGVVGEERFQLGAGQALVNSRAPVPTLLLYPSFFMGLVQALHELTLQPETLSLAAYAAGYTVYALDQAVLHPVGVGAANAVLAKPPVDAMPPSSLTRFEHLAGFSFTHGTASIRAMLGIFGVLDAYAQRMPPLATLDQQMNRVLRPGKTEQPMFVTAFINLPHPPHPVPSYMLRFSYLRAIHSIPLMLYTGGEKERALRASFPNTLAYPDNSLLPRSLLAQGMSPVQLFKRNKLPLLLRATKAFPSYDYLAWIDMDTFPHPICPDARLDCTALMDDRVHIGWVEGRPDTSFMIAPRWLLSPLVKAVRSITQLDADMQRGFSERQLFRRLIKRHPDLFTLHPLPRKGLLALTCLDDRLLSLPLQQELVDLPNSIRIPQPTPGQKVRSPHV